MSGGHGLSVFPEMYQRTALKKHTASRQGLNSLTLSEVNKVQTLLAACDKSTNAHVQRVVFLAEAVAQALQLSEKEIFSLCLAALLHDIGKVGIPESILNKPGPLEASERQVVRRHPEIGQQMLLQAGGNFASLAPLVAAHHERWDGRGYPNGLAGEGIPLAARIITVVDSYDVMIQRRVYQEPRPAFEAYAELQRCAGAQFDPLIIRVFLPLLIESTVSQEPSRRIALVDDAKFAEVICALLSLQSRECMLVSA